MIKTVKVDELTRVEGHGGIEVVLIDKKAESVKFNIFEGPRFFEHLIKGLVYDKIPDVTRRICAICTASHSLASIAAIEDAFGIEATQQTNTLRDLLIHGEIIESHALHVFMLALPDFLGFPDAIAMAEKHRGIVEKALKLKMVGNLIHTTLSGREVHGMNERVGGFSHVPTEEELIKLRRSLVEVKPTTELAVDIIAELQLPKYSKSQNNLIAIDSGKRFGYLGNHLITSNGERISKSRYRELTNEMTVAHSYAKFSYYKGEPYMVGALPRIILLGNRLEGAAIEKLRTHRKLVDPDNSINNNFCQALELIHAVDRSIADIDDLLLRGLKREALVDIKIHEGQGVGAVEAPRGVLYHDYSFDTKGRITCANIITPTAQNAANIEKDASVVAENMAESNEDEMRHALEVMIRAYDPCISCSVHITRIK